MAGLYYFDKVGDGLGRLDLESEGPGVQLQVRLEVEGLLIGGEGRHCVQVLGVLQLLVFLEDESEVLDHQEPQVGVGTPEEVGGPREGDAGVGHDLCDVVLGDDLSEAEFRIGSDDRH